MVRPPRQIPFGGKRAVALGPRQTPALPVHSPFDTARGTCSTRRVALKVLIVPDKFKGTLTAIEAAQCMAAGWSLVRPADRLELLPMSDGGDGFGEMMGLSLRASAQTVQTVDAAHRPCRALWWWDPKTRTAVIEAARVNGLAMLQRGKYHPFKLDTFGLGAVFCAAAKKRPRRCLIGIGGSATNDAGFGMARALGWRFLDRHGNELARWTDLPRLVCARPPPAPLKLGKVTVAVDVQNPLLGPRGCTRVYGPQKGLLPEDFPLAERALRRLVKALPQGPAIANAPGAGAAGGLGFGLMAFLGAGAEPGFELFARLARLARRLRGVDLVLTGEGALDRSSFMGKGVGELAKMCRAAKVRCVGLAGGVPDERLALKHLDAVSAVVPALASADEALIRPAALLTKLAARAAESLPRTALVRHPCSH